MRFPPPTGSLPPPLRRPAVAGRTLPAVLLGAVVVVAVGVLVLQFERRPEHAPVGRGEVLAREAGCFACHGRGDGEPRFNLRRTGESLTAKNNPTFWDGDIRKRAELVDWITNGVTASHAERHKKLLIQMPAYGNRLPADEIDAIAAWILAEGLKLSQLGNLKKPVVLPTPLPADANARFVLGDRLARKNGCYQCHGELGQGGIANPSSFKGYIPGFFGSDLRALTAGGQRDEVLHWIEKGRGRDIESGLLGGVARRIFAHQALGMPAYAEALTPAEREVLADFVLELNRQGPLPAAEVERIFALVDQSSP